MFCHCIGLTILDLSEFDTSNVSNMSYMFCGCYNLEVLDLSGFDTTSVKDIHGIFQECNALKKVYLTGCNSETNNKIKEQIENARLANVEIIY